VIAPHYSGAGSSQWYYVAEVRGGRYEVRATEHYGCETSGPWTGEHAFALTDEAARAIALVDKSEEKVHLIGHSYGGGVALRVALARPSRIASMVTTHRRSACCDGRASRAPGPTQRSPGLRSATGWTDILRRYPQVEIREDNSYAIGVRAV
jgi:pimeloyl-ACP methyl ester carboxylesterase